jgi:hypothetical protein
MGPLQLAAQLARPERGSWRVTPATIYRLLRQHGLQTRLERLTRLEGHSTATQGLLTERTRRRLARTHVEAQRPGDLVCVDAFSIGNLQGVSTVWPLTACDAACSWGWQPSRGGSPGHTSELDNLARRRPSSRPAQRHASCSRGCCRPTARRVGRCSGS